MNPTPAAALSLENEELRQRLREAEELITAIRAGAVDALAIQGAEGPRIFTLESADTGYRALIEQMSEGAVLLDADGLVLYCNAALPRLLGRDPAALLGQYFGDFVPPEYRGAWAELCAQGWQAPARGELALPSGPTPAGQPPGSAPALRPFSVSINRLSTGIAPTLAVLLADLSARQRIENIRSVVARQNALLDYQSEELVRQ